MTQTQKSMLDKALARAIAQDITVIGTGILRATGARVWFVTSGVGDGSSYMVMQVSSSELTCTCKAGQQGHYCKHRALVTARLMHEKQLVNENSENNTRGDLAYSLNSRDSSLMQRNDGGPRLWR